MERINFRFNRSSFLHEAGRAIALHAPLLLGVACFIAAVPSHAQPVIIEANSWGALAERLPCLRATKTPDDNWLVSGTFLINGQYFYDPTISDHAFAEHFRRKCATEGGGSSGTNTSRSGQNNKEADYAPSSRSNFDADGFVSQTGGGGASTGAGSSATTSMFSGTTTPPSGVSQIDAAVAVPSPAVGAGLPGLIAACGALVVFARIRRKKVTG
jgi:hypothetical protein